MSNEKLDIKFDNDWTEEELQKRKKNWKRVQTIPVGVEFKAEHRVLNLDEVKKYLEKAQKIAVLDCECRTKSKQCDAPLDVCLFLNEQAEVALSSEDMQNSNPRGVSFTEAVEILERSHEAGLVHLALSIQQIETNTICSCCTCCCVILSAILRFGLAPHLLFSEKFSVTDNTLCNDCGVCIERCQFGARKLEDGKLKVNNEYCYGCGLCVTVCPTQAITLKNKQ